MVTESPREETARCFGLCILNLLLLPFSILGVCIYALRGSIVYFGSRIRSQNGSRSELSQRTILVTGVGMAKGLTLARSFYLSGHRVIGADFENSGIPCSGRYSRSVSAFYRLSRPDTDDGKESYVSSLLDIIQAENVELWVSCSGVASAIEDAEAKESIEKYTSCKCIQFDVNTTSALHEKNSFMSECKTLGLPVPETYEVKSKNDILRTLSRRATSTSGRKFILKPTGMDDAYRADMTLLPLPSKVETEKHISRLPISDSNPWILQQFIPGGEEYCTHALVVRGEVRCFVACSSAELLMHYKALPQNSPLWQAMLAFTIEFVRRWPGSEDMTGHLSFDFMASEGAVNYEGFQKNIYAIECNPRAHTAVVLFAQQGPEMDAMVQAYLSVVEQSPHQMATSLVGGGGLPASVESILAIPPANAQPRYWIGHDLVSLFIYPAYQWSTGSADISYALSKTLEFRSHLLLWKEGTFEIWDPLPALSLYHIYFPLTVLFAWWQGKHWTRINVSTTKMFSR